MSKVDDIKAKYVAKREATQASQPANNMQQRTGNTAPVQSSKVSNITQKYDKKRTPTSYLWKLDGEKYITNGEGLTSRYNVTKKQRKKEDVESIAKTGHETFGTDLGQALEGGTKTWLANQFSSAGTLRLGLDALLHGDNNYQPAVGSDTWKLLQASSARTREAAELTESAKEGRGKIGTAVMDVATQMGTNGIDHLLYSIPVIGKVLGTASFVSRSFGASSQQARDEGKSVGTQVISGAVSAAIEQITESMWRYGGQRDYLGNPMEDTGWLGRLTDTATRSLDSKIGPILSHMAMSFGTEFVEEAMADVLNPIASSLVRGTVGKTGLARDYEGERWQGVGNMLYDGLIGGLSGIFGGAVEGVRTQSTINRNYGGDVNAYITAQRQEQEQQSWGSLSRIVEDNAEKLKTKKGRKELRPLAKRNIRENFRFIYSEENGYTKAEADELADKFMESFNELTDDECKSPAKALNNVMKRWETKVVDKYMQTEDVADEAFYIKEGETIEEALKRFEEYHNLEANGVDAEAAEEARKKEELRATFKTSKEREQRNRLVSDALADAQERNTEAWQQLKAIQDREAEQAKKNAESKEQIHENPDVKAEKEKLRDQIVDEYREMFKDMPFVLNEEISNQELFNKWISKINESASSDEVKAVRMRKLIEMMEAVNEDAELSGNNSGRNESELQSEPRQSEYADNTEQITENERGTETEQTLASLRNKRGERRNSTQVKEAVWERTGGELQDGEVSHEKSKNRREYARKILSQAKISEDMQNKLLDELLFSSRWVLVYEALSGDKLATESGDVQEERREYVRGLVAPELLAMISEGDLASLMHQFRKAGIKDSESLKALQEARRIMSEQEHLYKNVESNNAKAYNTNAVVDYIISRQSGKNNKVATISDETSKVGDADTLAFKKSKYVANDRDFDVEDTSGIDSPYTIIGRVVNGDIKYFLVDDEGYISSPFFTSEEQAFAAAHQNSQVYAEAVIGWKYLWSDGIAVNEKDLKNNGNKVLDAEEIFGKDAMINGVSGDVNGVHYVARNRSYFSDALGVKYGTYANILADTNSLTVDLSGANPDQVEVVVRKLMDTMGEDGGVRLSNGKTYVFIGQPANARKDGIIRLIEKSKYEKLRKNISGFLTEDEKIAMNPAKFMANQGVSFSPSNTDTGTKIRDVVIMKDWTQHLYNTLVNYMVTDLENKNDEHKLTQLFKEAYEHNGDKNAIENAKAEAQRILKNAKSGQALLLLFDVLSYKATDGFGLMWNDLGVGNSAQVRVPGIKGFMVQFDFYSYLDSFLQEMDESELADNAMFWKDKNGKIWAKDTWGEWTELAGKKAIMFESMFKFSGAYNDLYDKDARNKFYENYGNQDLRSIPKENVYGSNKSKGMVEGKVLKSLGQVFRKELGFTQEEVDRVLVSNRLMDIQQELIDNPSLLVKMFGKDAKKGKYTRTSNLEAAFVSAFGEDFFRYGLGKKWAAKKLSKMAENFRGAKVLFDENNTAYNWVAPDVLSLLHKMADVTELGFAGLAGRVHNSDGTYTDGEIFVNNIEEGDTLVARSPSAETADAQIRKNVKNEQYLSAVKNFSLDPNVAYLALDDNLGLHLDNDFDGDAVSFSQGVGMEIIRDKRQERLDAKEVAYYRTDEKGNKVPVYTSFDIPTIFAHEQVNDKLKTDDKVEITNDALVKVIRRQTEADAVGIFDMGIDYVNAMSDKQLENAVKEYNEKPELKEKGIEYTVSGFRALLAARYSVAYKYAFDYAKTGFFPAEFKTAVNMTEELIDIILESNGYKIHWADEYGKEVSKEEAATDKSGRYKKVYGAPQPTAIEYETGNKPNKNERAEQARRGEQRLGNKYIINEGNALSTVIANSRLAKQAANTDELTRRLTRSNNANNRRPANPLKLSVLATVDPRAATQTLLAYDGLEDMLRFMMKAVNYQYLNEKGIESDQNGRENAKKLLYKLQKSLNLDGEQFTALMLVALDADLNTNNIDTLLKFDQRSIDKDYKGATTAEIIGRNLAIYAAVNEYNDTLAKYEKLSKDITDLKVDVFKELSKYKSKNKLYYDYEVDENVKKQRELLEEYGQALAETEAQMSHIDNIREGNFASDDVRNMGIAFERLDAVIDFLKERKEYEDAVANLKDKMGNVEKALKDMNETIPKLEDEFAELSKELSKNKRAYDYAMEIAELAKYNGDNRSGDFTAYYKDIYNAIANSEFAKEMASNIARLKTISTMEFDKTILDDLVLKDEDEIEKGEAPKIISKQENDSYYDKNSKKNSKELARKKHQLGDAEIVYWAKKFADPNQEFVVFDTETTGTADNDELIQISAYVYKDGKIVEDEFYDTFVKPSKGIPSDITSLTGINDEMVANSPDSIDAVFGFLNFVGDRPLIAHNAGFDVHFIEQVAKKAGAHIDNDVIDTVAIARALFQEGENNLDAVADKLNVDVGNIKRHNAGADVELLARVMKAMSDRFDEYLANREKVIPANADFLPDDIKTRLFRGRETLKFFDELGQETGEMSETRVPQTDNTVTPETKAKQGTAADVENFERAKRWLRTRHKDVSNLVYKMKEFKSAYASDKDNLLGKRNGKNPIISKRIAEKIKAYTDKAVEFNNGTAEIGAVAEAYKGLEGTRYYSEDVMKQFEYAISNMKEQEEALRVNAQAGNKDNRYTKRFGDMAYAALSMSYKYMQRQEYAIQTLQKFNEAVEKRAVNLDKHGAFGRAAARLLRRQINSPTMFKFITGFEKGSVGYDIANDIANATSLKMSLIAKSYNFFSEVSKKKGYAELVKGDTKASSVLTDKKYDKIKDMSLADLIYAVKSMDSIDYSEALYNRNIDGVVVGDKVYDKLIIENRSEIMKKIMQNELAAEYINATDELMNAYDLLAQRKFLQSYGFAPFTQGKGHHVPVQFVQVIDGKVIRTNEEDDWNYERATLKDPTYTMKGISQDANYIDIIPMAKAIDKYVTRLSDYIAFKDVRDTLSALNMKDGSDLNLADIAGTNWGADFGNWMNTYVKDATSTSPKQDSALSKARVAVEQGILVGSPSVMMKQFASYFNAMGILSARSLFKAAKVMGSMRDFGQDIDAIKYRLEKKAIDPALHDILTTDTGIVSRVLHKIPGYNLLESGISRVDNFTVNALYIATLYEMMDNGEFKNYDLNDKDQRQKLIEKIEDKFNEVVIYTQPMFERMLRAEYQRTDNEAIRLLSMFRTQQTQTANRILTTIGEYQADKKAGRDTTESRKVMKQTLSGMIASSFALSLFTVIADVLLHKTKKYRDDEGEVDVGKVAERLFFLNPLENAAGTVWFGDEAAKYIIDLISGETSESYGVNIGFLSTLNNAMDAVKSFAEQGSVSSARYAAGYISQLFGIPLNNIYAYLNSIGSYVADATDTNPHHYDDMIRIAEKNNNVNKELSPSQRALVEFGMPNADATDFIKAVDVDSNGSITQKELEDLYLSDPEAAGAIQAIWDTQGWSGDWESKQQKLDRHILYTQNPLYSALDANHDEKLSQKEVVNYLLDNGDANYKELAQIWEENEWAADFDDAVKQMKNKRIKDEVDEAYEAGNYNVLFETLKDYDNGKAYLADKISDDTGDNLTSNTNLVLGYILNSNLSINDFDDAVNQYADKKTLKLYTTMRDARIQNKDALRIAMAMDVNESGTISQSDFVEFYKKNKDKEKIVEMLWNSMGYSGKYTKTWAAYKKRNKIS